MSLRHFLLFCLVLASGFAGWAWLKPYDWSPDPGARCAIRETLVTRDQSYFWVTVRLEVNSGQTHDLQKPVRLETSTGKFLEPADTTFAGDNPLAATGLWLKFWLEATDAEGPLTLHLNDGKLVVKARRGIPDLGNSSHRNYTSLHW